VGWHNKVFVQIWAPILAAIFSVFNFDGRMDVGDEEYFGRG
jgi:hypothetical protein